MWIGFNAKLLSSSFQNKLSVHFFSFLNFNIGVKVVKTASDCCWVRNSIWFVSFFSLLQCSNINIISVTRQVELNDDDDDNLHNLSDKIMTSQCIKKNVSGLIWIHFHFVFISKKLQLNARHRFLIWIASFEINQSESLGFMRNLILIFILEGITWTYQFFIRNV